MSTLNKLDPWINQYAFWLGSTFLLLGGTVTAVAAFAWCYEKLLTYSLRVFGEGSQTWWDVFKEMHRQKKLRWQKRKP